MTSTFLDVQRALGRRAKGVIVRLSWKWEVDVLSLVTGHSRRDMRVIDNLANHMSGNHHTAVHIVQTEKTSFSVFRFRMYITLIRDRMTANILTTSQIMHAAHSFAP